MTKRKQAEVSKEDDVPSKRGSGEAAWSKSKKKRMRRLKGKQKQLESAEQKKGVIVVEESVEDEPSNGAPAETTSTSALQKSFMARLSGSRFRELNEVRLLKVS